MLGMLIYAFRPVNKAALRCGGARQRSKHDSDCGEGEIMADHQRDRHRNRRRNDGSRLGRRLEGARTSRCRSGGSTFSTPTHRLGHRLTGSLSGLAGLHQVRLYARLPELQPARRGDEGRRGRKGEPSADAGRHRHHPTRGHREERRSHGVRAAAAAAAQFAQNCAPCHGKGAQGAKGYPNLNDDDWLWGGFAGRDRARRSSIGIRSGSKDGHDSAMPRFGIDQIADAGADQRHGRVRSVSVEASRRTRLRPSAARRSSPSSASRCHGPTARAHPEFGAPNLTDGIWLYGGEQGRHPGNDPHRPRRRHASTGQASSTPKPSRCCRSTFTRSAAANKSTACGRARKCRWRGQTRFDRRRRPQRRRPASRASTSMPWRRRPPASAMPRARRSIPSSPMAISAPSSGTSWSSRSASTTCCRGSGGTAGRACRIGLPARFRQCPAVLRPYRDLGPGALFHHRRPNRFGAGPVSRHRPSPAECGADSPARRRSGPTS